MRVILVLIAFFVSSQFSAQESLLDSMRRNTVRLNITPMLLTNWLSVAVGYERILNERQSFSMNIGHLGLPHFASQEGESVDWVEKTRNTGFLVAADYRFYLTGRNKYPIPDGFYIAPYVTYYYFDDLSSVKLLQDDQVQASANIQAYVNALMVGVQAGYQFVFKDRFSLDLIFMGPGYGFYSGSVSIYSDIELEGNEDYIQGVYDTLLSVFPGLSRILKDEIISGSGRAATSGLGFRYVLQVGYRF